MLNVKSKTKADLIELLWKSGEKKLKELRKKYGFNTKVIKDMHDSNDIIKFVVKETETPLGLFKERVPINDRKLLKRLRNVVYVDLHPRIKERLRRLNVKSVYEMEWFKKQYPEEIVRDRIEKIKKEKL